MAEAEHKITATNKISTYSVITVTGNSTIRNYYALVLAIVISGTAIYTLSIQSDYLINAVNTIFLGFLDLIAFYFAFVKVHTERSSRSI